MNPGVANSLFPSQQQADRATIKWYQSAMDFLMWPALHTRHNIAYLVGVLFRYCANPGTIYCNLVTQIFRYLAGTWNLGITFRSNTTDELVEYTDSDWAGLKDGQRSTGGYAFLLSGGPVSHQSKQQATVAFFSTEAEYMATTKAGKEALWIARFWAALGYRLPDQPISLRADNRGAILFTAHPEFHRRIKHIEVRHHWIREKVESRKIAITYISTKDMVADGLTKALDPKPFKAFRVLIGMHWIGSHKTTEWEYWKCSHIVPAYSRNASSASHVFGISYIVSGIVSFIVLHIVSCIVESIISSFVAFYISRLLHLVSQIFCALSSISSQFYVSSSNRV